MIDLQYHDIRRPGRYYKLEESDAVDRIATDDEIQGDLRPAKDTARVTSAACACSGMRTRSSRRAGDSVIFDLKEGPLKKIFMLEPLRGTEAHVRSS